LARSWRQFTRTTLQALIAICDNCNSWHTKMLEVLMDAVRVCSLGQITNALFEVGGQYRRSM
jgi:methylmalonyl-CoA mutase